MGDEIVLFGERDFILLFKKKDLIFGFLLYFDYLYRLSKTIRRRCFFILVSDKILTSKLRHLIKGIKYD